MVAQPSFQPVSHHIHPVTLTFYEGVIEQEYRNDLLPGLRRQARLAILMGLALWVLFGVTDTLFLYGYAAQNLVYLHAIIISIAVMAIMSTYLPQFNHANQVIIMLVAIVTGIALTCKMLLMPGVSVLHYFPGMLLLVFWSYTYSGLRFIPALLSTILISIGFVMVCVMQFSQTTSDLISYNLYLAAANILAAASSYSIELQSRKLFLVRREIDSERIHHLSRALHDSLTHLPNRELLEDRLELAISQSMRDERQCAGFFIDLDGFKEINDTYGHEIGDMFLQEVAARLRDIMREADTLSRIGGDEFFVLARDIADRNAAKVLGQKLLQQLQQPFMLSEIHTIPGITASIGVSFFPYRHCSAADIVRRADQAMYRVKRGGKAGIAFAEDYEVDDSTA